jgi:hypothetical protein
MLSSDEGGSEGFSETHWKSLRYFNIYRLAVASLLFFSALLYPSAFPVCSLRSTVCSICCWPVSIC